MRSERAGEQAAQGRTVEEVRGGLAGEAAEIELARRSVPEDGVAGLTPGWAGRAPILRPVRVGLRRAACETTHEVPEKPGRAGGALPTRRPRAGSAVRAARLAGLRERLRVEPRTAVKHAAAAAAAASAEVEVGGPARAGRAVIA